MSINVTAAITTCRRKRELIERAIESVEQQTYPVYEILLINDNHPKSRYYKEAEELAKQHPLVKHIPCSKNMGVSYARNLAMKHAKGDYIAFLDDDDVWRKQKLYLQVKVIEKHPDTALVFGMGQKMYKDGTKGELTWSSTIYKRRPSYWDMLKNDHVGSASHPLISLKVMRELNGFLTENQPAVEDYELWIRISKHHAIRGVKGVLYDKYMPEGDHVSGNHRNVYRGYKNIYYQNYREYNLDLDAKINIYYNMLRRAVMGLMPEAIPCGITWLSLKIKRMMYRL